MISMLMVNNVVLRFIPPKWVLSSKVEDKNHIYIWNTWISLSSCPLGQAKYFYLFFRNYRTKYFRRNDERDIATLLFSSLPCVNACVFTPHYSWANIIYILLTLADHFGLFAQFVQPIVSYQEKKDIPSI